MHKAGPVSSEPQPLPAPPRLAGAVALTVNAAGTAPVSLFVPENVLCPRELIPPGGPSTIGVRELMGQFLKLVKTGILMFCVYCHD